MGTDNEIEQWGMFEAAFSGPDLQNPYTDLSLSATFTHQQRSVEVRGFYDSDGTYRVRHMPDRQGEWSFTTSSNQTALDGIEGHYQCVSPEGDNHGPVLVDDTYHFQYADGTPYRPFGTTCYVWNHQSAELQEQTLEELATSPFNKIRMCVFPKWFDYNRHEPIEHPFELDDDGQIVVDQINPQSFQHLDRQIEALGKIGIEVDLILFHPYDKWGYEEMPPEADDRYLRYVIARLGAYRNVWWSLANEWDLLDAKSTSDWDRFFRIILEEDPYGHLRSIHNCVDFYDQHRSWVTHLSIQYRSLDTIRDWRDEYRKPIVVDECGYEGTVPTNWGGISAHRMMNNFWVGVTGGGYVTHGETYPDDDDIIWWSHGGKLHGESPDRITFLRDLVEAAPGHLEPCTPAPTLRNVYRPLGVASDDRYFLYYFEFYQPGEWTFELPEGREFVIDLIDPWEMTIEEAVTTVRGPQATVDLPGRPYLAVRARATQD